MTTISYIPLKPIIDERAVYYLRSCLRMLRGLSAATGNRADGLSLGSMALADNVDWLDCFIDEAERGLHRRGIPEEGFVAPISTPDLNLQDQARNDGIRWMLDLVLGEEETARDQGNDLAANAIISLLERIHAAMLMDVAAPEQASAPCPAGGE